MPSILRPAVPLIAALLMGVAACGGDAPPETAIDRETFIETYVDLRAATMAAGGTELPAERRDEVLDRHGVTEDDLLEFARVHGSDPVYMRDLWAEVEQRMVPLGEGSGPGGEPEEPVG